MQRRCLCVIVRLNSVKEKQSYIRLLKRNDSQAGER